MSEPLDKALARYEEVLAELADSSAASDSLRLSALMKEQSQLSPIVAAHGDAQAAEAEIASVMEMMKSEDDPEMKELLASELKEEKAKLAAAKEALARLLAPKDADADRNVIMEIRAGAGGDEAALFAADLYRMYAHYAERCGFRCEMISLSESERKGFKECIFRIEGAGAYSRLKFESGTHRVQRVPVTESGGRIHTSTATVAVLPEAEEVDVEVDPADCRVDVFRATGNGGQCVNTTDSAVRITHLPTGIVVSCQDEKSQLKNRAKAMKVLRARLYEKKRQEEHEKRAGLRRSQVGTADRSEKIRTYNFGQGRVTDHRIHLTLYRIDEILEGDLDEIVGALQADEAARRLAGEGEEDA